MGFWQLDRLEQRRAYNHVAARWDEQPYDLVQNSYRPIFLNWSTAVCSCMATMIYANQIVLKNQFHNDAPGVNLVTPLRLPDGRRTGRSWLGSPFPVSARAWSQFELLPANKLWA
ncbi:MAG: SURF1 family cytochrome oxidase biogenesis protein [Caldilineaceae bacterium]